MRVLATEKANLHDITPSGPTPPAARPDFRGTAGLPLSVNVLDNGATEIANALEAREATSVNLATRMFELQTSLVLFLVLLAGALLYQG